MWRVRRWLAGAPRAALDGQERDRAFNVAACGVLAKRMKHRKAWELRHVELHERMGEWELWWRMAPDGPVLGRGQLLDLSFTSSTFVARLFCPSKGVAERKEFMLDEGGVWMEALRQVPTRPFAPGQ